MERRMGAKGLLGMHCFVWKGEGSRSCCAPVVSMRKINCYQYIKFAAFFCL